MTVRDDESKSRKLFGWLSIENGAQMVIYAVTLTLAFGSVKSDVRDITTISSEQGKRISALERQEHDTHELLLDLKGEMRELRAEFRSMREMRARAE